MKQATRVILHALAVLLFCLPVGSWAQGGGSNPAPPPPPPAEGLNPATAPASSRESLAAPDAGAPAPPAEGLDPKHAPASSREAVAPEISEGDEMPLDTSGSADKSPAAVYRLDFMQRALVAGLLVGGVSAFLGVYVVLRRIVFVGIALSEMSSAGVALATLMNIAPMIGSVLTMFAGVLLFSVRWGGKRIRQDAFIGIGYVVASAGAVLLLSKSASGEGSLMSLLFGDILTVTSSDIWATAIALAITVLFHALFYKELLFVAFDPDTASASGYPVRFWELALYLTVGLTIAFSIHAVGVLMTFASLIIPPVTALLLTRRMETAFAVAILAGMIPVPVGLYISYVADLPSTATVVVLEFVLLILAGIVSRFRH